MTNLISSPFFFDDDTVRSACVAALGLSAVDNEILPIASSTITLTKADHVGKIIATTVADPSAVVITVPDDITGEFEDKDQITIIRAGTGAVTIVAGGGVTIQTTESLTLRKQYSAVQLIRRGADTWFLVGDTVASDSDFITSADVPAINTVWPHTSQAITQLGNVSYRGVKPTVVGNTITVPALFGMNFEAQLDGIAAIDLSSAGNTSFRTTDISSTAGVDVTIDIGVSPFPIGGEKWIMGGVRITRVGGTWSCATIANGVVDSPPSNITDILDAIIVNFNGTTNAMELFRDTSHSVNVETLQDFNDPLYTRLFISGPTTGTTSITFTLDSRTNGKGDTLPVRFTSVDDDIIEVTANVT